MPLLRAVDAVEHEARSVSGIFGECLVELPAIEVDIVEIGVLRPLERPEQMPWSSGGRQLAARPSVEEEDAGRAPRREQHVTGR